jgi:serine/threonine-protein kinase RsbW
MSRTRTPLAELRLPADPAYIMVAKRTAAGLASVAGFSLEEIDDLSIAISQACESAIAAGRRLWGPSTGQLRVTFRADGGRMEVEVRSVAPRAAETPAERAPVVAHLAEEGEYAAVGMNMIRLFVDELRYQHDDVTGAVRMRMVKSVKYLIG